MTTSAPGWCWLWAMLLAPSAALAVSGRVELGRWHYAIDGAVSNGAALDLQDDFNPRTRRRDYHRFDLAFAPVWIPELSLSRHYLDVRGARAVDSSLQFGALTLIPAETVVDAFIAVDDFTGTARYRIGQRSDSLHALAGVSVRRLSGEVQVREQDGGEIEREPIDEWFPQIHLAGLWRVNDTVSLSLEGDWIAYRGDTAWQGKAAIDVAAPLGLGVTAGYTIRHFQVGGSSTLDARFQGAHVGLAYRW